MCLNRRASQTIDKSIGDSETARRNTGGKDSTARRDSRRIDSEENRFREENTRAGDEAKRGYERREHGRERKKKMKCYENRLRNTNYNWRQCIYKTNSFQLSSTDQGDVILGAMLSEFRHILRRGCC